MRHYKNRLICFLDVLGYSAMVQKLGIEEVYSKYSQFVDVAKNKVFFGTPKNYEGPSTNFEVSEVFSDSILLVSHDTDNVASVNNFLGSIHFFLELGLASGFMFRGCINQGDIIYDDARNIVLSEEFNELAKFEPVMDAPVCVVFEKASLTILSSLFGGGLKDVEDAPTRALPIFKWSVPLKGGVTKDLWCINYTFFCDKGEVAAAVEYLAGDKVKQKNFINYLSFIDSMPDEKFAFEGEGANGVYVKMMRSRSGVRVAFEGGDGQLTRAPIEWGFPQVFVKPPEEIALQYNPQTQETKFHVIGRWK